MEIVLAFIAGSALTYLTTLLLAGGKAAARDSAIEPPAPATPRAAPSPPERNPSALARLQEMTPALDAVGEASAHPRDLSSNETFREAVALLRSTEVPLSAVIDYATGANWMLSACAYAALGERADQGDALATLTAQFRHVRPWPMHYALLYFLKQRERPALGELVLQTPEWWADSPVIPAYLSEHFAQRQSLGDAPTFGAALNGLQGADVASAQTLLAKVTHPYARELAAVLAAWKAKSVDREFLQSFGRFLEEDLEQQLLIEHDALKEQLALGEACLEQARVRSVLAIGEARVGKSAFLRLLGARASKRGWILFEASAASLMSGQQYIGQLEERLRRITTELAVEKRVLWCIPDLLQLAMSGTHSGQAASILDQILPAIASGRIAVVSETTPAGLTRLLQRKPAIRSAMELIRLRAPNESETLALSRQFGDRMAHVLGVSVTDAVLDSANHLARYYLGVGQTPGAVIDLLKLSAQHAAANEADRLEQDHLLATLAQVTGMPRSVLDDRERVELSVMRAFFGARVMGQEEAVNAVVDRIAMLKAGLTDPARPIGVFLFAGPTGTGKTELAKTLAEYLFGSSERMLRLDMSEFQMQESTRKILGEPGEGADSDALTQRVRKQPFSVVLLDEFEKAHPNIWDLFLQVFDDGRLTDAIGHTVDFRHTIVILTSNLGATAHQSGGLGFAPQASAFSQQQVLRAVGQSFRPEFVNRLDKVLVFRPLTRELMRGILAKELAQVLERRGLRNRAWAVEWESSALEFLLEKGFSPAMGARPLKRAIDQYLLAPLAATMVERRFPEGDQFLFVRSDGAAIQVEFVDPDAPQSSPALEADARPSEGPSLPRLMLQPAGDAVEKAALGAELQRLERQLSGPRWESLRAELSGAIQRADFWERDERHAVLARYALMDRIRAAIDTARVLDARLARSETRRGGYSRELTSRLASQLFVVARGVDDALTNAPVEVVLQVQPVMEARAEAHSTRDWCERIEEMYRRWAVRRRMQLTEVRGAANAAALLVITGFGAARTLAEEIGLHVLEGEGRDEEGGRRVARVKIAPTPFDASGEPRYDALLQALDAQPSSAMIVRRYRLGAASLIRDARSGWRTGRAELVLDGDFDLLAALAEA